jgi:hypothetical protein
MDNFDHRYRIFCGCRNCLLGDIRDIRLIIVGYFIAKDHLHQDVQKLEE